MSLLKGVFVYPLVSLTLLLKMAIELVDIPMKNGEIFYSYVSLPEGILLKMPAPHNEVGKYSWNYGSRSNAGLV